MAAPAGAPTSVPPSLPIAALPAPAPVPAGVGAAPTRIEASPAAERQVGFFEKCVLRFKHLILSLLRLIFPRWKWLESFAHPPLHPAPSPSPPTAALAPLDPRAAQAKTLLEQLRNGVMPFNLTSQFESFFLESERKAVYRALGESAPFTASEHWTHWRQTAIDERNEKTGRAMVERNAGLLVSYLIPRLQQIIS